MFVNCGNPACPFCGTVIRPNEIIKLRKENAMAAKTRIDVEDVFDNANERGRYNFPKIDAIEFWRDGKKSRCPCGCPRRVEIHRIR